MAPLPRFINMLLARSGTQSSLSSIATTSVAAAAVASPPVANSMSTSGSDIGIIAGSAIAGSVLLFGVLFFLYRRERKLRARRRTVDLTEESATGASSEYHEKSAAVDDEPALPTSNSTDESFPSTIRPPQTTRNLDSVYGQPPRSSVELTAGLPSRPDLSSRTGSQQTLSDTRPWPPTSRAQTPEYDTSTPSPNIAQSAVRFQDPPPQSRRLFLIGSPAVSASPASTPGYLTPEPLDGFNEPETTRRNSSASNIYELTGQLQAARAHNAPPPVHSQAPPSPPPGLASRPSTPVAVQTATVPEISTPSRAHTGIHVRPARAIPPPALARASNMHQGRLAMPTEIPVRVPTLSYAPSARAPPIMVNGASAPTTVPDVPTSLRTESSSPSPPFGTTPLPTSMNRSASRGKRLRVGLPASPRPVRSPSSSTRSSSAEQNTGISRSFSASEVRAHRASGEFDVTPGTMLWRYPTARERAV